MSDSTAPASFTSLHKNSLSAPTSPMADLLTLVESERVTPWTDLAPQWQSTFTQATLPGKHPIALVSPQNLQEMGQVIQWANRHHTSLLPCGQGSKLHWGGLVEGPSIALSTRYLSSLVDHAVGDMTVTVEAGMPFAQLQQTLAQTGQWLPLDPAYADRATIGGLIATASAGSLRQRYGGVRDLLIGVSFLRADGQLAKAGGRVVKNVAGYDLMKLLTGSYGTLGIITQATFRAYPLPDLSETVMVLGDAGTIAPLTRTLLAGNLTPVVVDLLSEALTERLVGQRSLALLVRFQGLAASVQEQLKRLEELVQQVNGTQQRWSGADETDLWQRLRTLMEPPCQETLITCKIGVRASEVEAVLAELDRQVPGQFTQIHAGSGLGVLQLPETDGLARLLTDLRTLCRSYDGFLTLLQGSVALKQVFEPWGYGGNALDLMMRVKQQFDPKRILSPHRFVGGL
ncbi:MAG: FAD-binding oxidoreductase [Leptolyngbyaceae cyanobacterium bins.59]|nr:FAD-binding oxidoreductase [Leptolyngbyaceae cyanobacterium bins.59]